MVEAQLAEPIPARQRVEPQSVGCVLADGLLDASKISRDHANGMLET